MPLVDLHIHTYFSDGKYSPEQILGRAAEIGLKAIAFADHDNADAARHVRSLAPGTVPAVEVIPAVEFTTAWPGLDVPPGETDIDVLAYFVDLDSEALKAIEKAGREDMSQRITACCEWLTEAGFPITMEDVWERNRRFPSLNSLVTAIQEKAYADSWEAAVGLMFNGWEQGPPCKQEIGAVIEAIHAAGGLAVLAHPAAIACRGGLMRAKQVARLANLGLDGLEIYHHRNDDSARSHLLDLARRFNLVVSGGSDMHGRWYGLEIIGSQPVTMEMLGALRARHSQIAQH